ncbi:hypothetical protein RQM65_16760 [Pricia sp. S334]|uniref:Uncharacterized protein n=1 Tax=Pricia mediterranea TaxID=3076079 RepID=A0ABU3LB62_9FLAO|nr:hypothetical protein [Pricia sp. S334]MDT7830322.1 hypothetical protein [Pricia sp. S334]
MLFKRTNIEEKLVHLNNDEKVSQEILREVEKILNADSDSRKRIEKNISDSDDAVINDFDFDFLNTNNIYHLSQIKKVCIDYRLRFLDSKYFKGDIPPEAISKIKRLEQEHNIEVKGFKIMAPSKLFRLEDKDDPILFTPIGNNYYYLIHKWGNDLHPLRKMMMWPFKNIVNLTLLTIVISYFVALLTPVGLFSKGSSNAEFWLLFFFMFKCIAAMVIYYGFAMGKNFNPAIWNSKYYN